MGETGRDTASGLVPVKPSRAASAGVDAFPYLTARSYKCSWKARFRGHERQKWGEGRRRSQDKAATRYVYSNG